MLFCTDDSGHGDDDAIVPSRSGTVQVIRGCQMRAVILTELAKADPDFENQLLYVAREWLTLATLVEQFDVACNSHAPLGGLI